MNLFQNYGVNSQLMLINELVYPFILQIKVCNNTYSLEFSAVHKPWLFDIVHR